MVHILLKVALLLCVTVPLVYIELVKATRLMEPPVEEIEDTSVCDMETEIPIAVLPELFA
ncbi:hypothetical protein KIPB_013541, partial [Kipferlia bialata]|eukprot:g13541.t1